MLFLSKNFLSWAYISAKSFTPFLTFSSKCTGCSPKLVENKTKKFTFERERPPFLSKHSYYGQFLYKMCQMRVFWSDNSFLTDPNLTHYTKKLSKKECFDQKYFFGVWQIIFVWTCFLSKMKCQTPKTLIFTNIKIVKKKMLWSKMRILKLKKSTFLKFFSNQFWIQPIHFEKK